MEAVEVPYGNGLASWLRKPWDGKRGRYLNRLADRLNGDFPDQGALTELRALLTSASIRDRRDGLWVASELVRAPDIAIAAAVTSLTSEDPVDRYRAREIVANARGAVSRSVVAQALSSELSDSPDALDDPGDLTTALLNELVALSESQTAETSHGLGTGSDYAASIAAVANEVEALARLTGEQARRVPPNVSDLVAIARVSSELAELERAARAAWAREELRE